VAKGQAIRIVAKAADVPLRVEGRLDRTQALIETAGCAEGLVCAMKRRCCSKSRKVHFATSNKQLSRVVTVQISASANPASDQTLFARILSQKSNTPFLRWIEETADRDP